MDTDTGLVKTLGLCPEQLAVARDRLAKAVRDHDDHAAAAIKALRKLHIVAWLVAQLVRADDGVLA